MSSMALQLRKEVETAKLKGEHLTRLRNNGFEPDESKGRAMVHDTLVKLGYPVSWVRTVRVYWDTYCHPMHDIAGGYDPKLARYRTTLKAIAQNVSRTNFGGLGGQQIHTLAQARSFEALCISIRTRAITARVEALLPISMLDDHVYPQKHRLADTAKLTRTEVLVKDYARFDQMRSLNYVSRSFTVTRVLTKARSKARDR